MRTSSFHDRLLIRLCQSIVKSYSFVFLICTHTHTHIHTHTRLDSPTEKFQRREVKIIHLCQLTDVNLIVGSFRDSLVIEWEIPGVSGGNILVCK